MTPFSPMKMPAEAGIFAIHSGRTDHAAAWTGILCPRRTIRFCEST